MNNVIQFRPKQQEKNDGRRPIGDIIRSRERSTSKSSMTSAPGPGSKHPPLVQSIHHWFKASTLATN